MAKKDTTGRIDESLSSRTANKSLQGSSQATPNYSNISSSSSGHVQSTGNSGGTSQGTGGSGQSGGSGQGGSK